jgi:hypothetical protein
MSSWGFSLLLSLPFAVSRGRAVSAVIVGSLLLLILLVMFHSMEWTRGTSPSLMLRKFWAWLRGLSPPGFARKMLKRGEEFLKKGEWLKAVDLYVKNFDFDGMMSSNARIAMKNEAILSQLEILCLQVDYAFPAKQSGRLREDISDYFTVRKKYLTPTEFHGEELNRAMNEDRFKDELNHFLEARLVGAYIEFFNEFIRRLREHIAENGPFAPQPEMLSQGVFGDNMEEPDPFAQDEMETVAPFAGAAMGGGENMLNPSSYAPPVDSPYEDTQSPFGVDDPVDPFRDQTGTIHRLSGPNDAPQEATTAGFPSAPPEGFTSSPPPANLFDSGAAPTFPSSSPETGFPSAPSEGFASSPPPASPFGSLSSSSPEMAEESTLIGKAPASPFASSSSPFSSASSPAPSTGSGGFPSPTSTESSPPSGSGGFPGLGSGSSPFASQPSGSGGFPGLGSSNPFESKSNSSSGGFPSIAGSSSGPFPSPTGSFAGFPSADKKDES